MFSRFPTVRQRDRSDCGAACLAAIARYYHLRIPVARIRQLASTTSDGTNVLGMVDAARALGFEAKGVRAPEAALATLPKPFIAHFVLPDGSAHFVVVSSWKKEYVGLMDPVEGRRTVMNFAEFGASWSGVLILIAPSSSFQPHNESGSQLARFWHLVRPHRTVMAQAMVGAALYTLLGLSTAIYVEKIVDHVLVGGNRNLLNLLSVLMIGLLLVQVYVGSVKDLLTLRTGQKIDASLILGYYRHLLELPQHFFDTMRVGELVSRVGDAVKIRAFINDVAVDLVVQLLIVTFSLAIMFAYNWKLAVGVACLLPLYTLTFWVTNRLNRRSLRRLMEAGADLESHLVESLGSVSTIKRFGLEGEAKQKTEVRFVRLLTSVYHAGTTSIFSSSGSELISRLGVIAVLWGGSGFVLRNELTPGELMSFYALVGYLTGPATRLVTANRTVQDALIASDRLFEILDLGAESREQSTGIALDARRPGELAFEDVTFRYGSQKPVLDHLNLTFHPASITAIVGESGSGKSTLLALAQNLYAPVSGRVTVGNRDIRFIERRSLRRFIASVPQEVHLFAASVIQNIAPGESDPDIARVMEVCDLLGITEFADRLPMGFHTPLGENGSSLSGGQRQRIAIARALYRDPSILILDEATSNLDSVSEEYVRSVLLRLRSRGKTVIVIAHRLATVAHADRIIVLEQGRVTAEGTHRELLEGASLYPRLWRLQHRGSEAVELATRT